ncbi:HAD family hydrolase [Natronobiforma cellulositropha]|uniref:HAD family hydrolase n=1 Tax=Natronobiforma cellulositropha TaxID=1679076 RepID=UPI0021D5CFDC|nr:HAD family hydrolase [Natronobiforma cellulositropha]
MAYDALVFDNDGVLTTPTEMSALRRAVRTAFAEVGVSDPTDEYVDTLINPTVEALERIAGEYGVEPEPLWEEREQAAIAVQAAEIRAGRKTLYDDVATLESLSVPRAIVSNNQHETIRTIVEYFDLTGFDPWIGREPTIRGIERKKPTPYYLERALSELGVDDPLYVGDSRVDITAANACGIDSAYVHRPHRVDYELPERPTHEIYSLEELSTLVG